MTRKIIYVSGTRADYGLMRAVLKKLHTAEDVDLSICVTGMHLSSLYGHTVDEIIHDGLCIVGEIPVETNQTEPVDMAKALGYELIGMAELFARERPDVILLLGDRGEILAAAIAAVHLNIHIVHIHGGERSGTVDEMIRHAISKLAHFHFVATESSKNRLIKMGEKADNIFLIGAPGLDEVVDFKPSSREKFCERYGFQFDKPIALLLYHPVVQEYAEMEAQFEQVLQAAFAHHLQMICLEPNSDAGGHHIRGVLARYQNHHDLRIVKHLYRADYLDCLANVNVMLGNSSSGIIEAASFHLDVVNVGTRQNLRERSLNVIDVDSSYDAVYEGLNLALKRPKRHYTNVYGDGKTSERCYQLLSSLVLSPELLNKCNFY